MAALAPAFQKEPSSPARGPRPQEQRPPERAMRNPPDYQGEGHGHHLRALRREEAEEGNHRNPYRRGPWDRSRPHTWRPRAHPCELLQFSGEVGVGRSWKAQGGFWGGRRGIPANRVEVNRQGQQQGRPLPCLACLHAR